MQKIVQGRRDPDAERFPGDGLPPASEPKTPNPPTGQPDGRPNSRDPQPKPGDDRGRTFPSGRTNPQEGDSIDLMLDHLYLKADSYLTELANKSGGRRLRADTLDALPDAFAKIAAELRTQYAIGYYPANKAHDAKYRQIKVTTTRKSVVVRARPGYRAPS